MFPLSAVLFPRGKIPLRIFEPRYLDLIKRCMRENAGFGILHLENGSEVVSNSVNLSALCSKVGTEVRIVDFDQIEGNLLGILVEGFRRFQVRSSWEEADHLVVGEVEYLDEEPYYELGGGEASLVRLLKDLVRHPMVEKLNLDLDYSNGVDVSYRLAELLPIDPAIKQSLLELGNTRARLSNLSDLVKGFQK
ncbi:LON peptidase substrate-binding domain-containing protein [Gammaproteobacteria bacterium]|nr:LON peptidase substrate-binding domain-containing protein [Gammaproteobacteria bacterium]